ncbi:HipA domain-containing protein [Jannaschia pohangensis]|uniref:HipA domain-containing protein n=1 Tax=Jannaschia pohangensis TaxID=390807 RepID=UPI0015874320|nr:HipA domain-containing protein [Jannaschia pohangensis]
MRKLHPLCGVLSIFDYVIFTAIAFNTDAHAENYSVLVTASGASLAPIYEVTCAKPWPNVTSKQAMLLAKRW